jgi:formate dehydrogenase accessory protein FdhE
VADVWNPRVRRAAALAADRGPAATLLTFYERLLLAQKAICDSLPARLTGDIERDLDLVLPSAKRLIEQVASSAPAALADEARDLLDAPESPLAQGLITYWRVPTDRQFFAKAIVQPYAESLARAGVRPLDRPGSRSDLRCPFCGGAPQVSVVQAPLNQSGLEGGGRHLICATCLTAWPFGRVRCAYCGQHDESMLGYFHAREFSHIRIDACDDCGRYVKSIDLTRLGVAVPLVDEVAGATLDAWARDQGYQKIELNLVGI